MKKPSSKKPMLIENLLTVKQAAYYLGISERFLRQLKADGEIPFLVIGKRGVRFKISSLDKWIAEREIV